MSRSRILATGLLALVAVSTAACRQDMHDQPRYEPLEKSTLFADQRTSRPLIAGTVSRGNLKENVQFQTGRGPGGFVEAFPMKVDQDFIRKGQERFNIYCTPCHARTGEGNGMIVQRGYPRPADFHIDRLRNVDPGYFVHVIKNGFGVMPAYNIQMTAEERWAVAAYIKALQLSRSASLSDAPDAQRSALEAARER